MKKESKTQKEVNEELKKESEQNNQAQEETVQEEEKELTKKEQLEKRIEELELEVGNYKTEFLRARADYDNFRKRSQEEIARARESGIKSFVEDLLPALDNFEMSLKMTENTGMFIKGVEMIHKNLIDTLNEHKITPFEPKIGEEFNPVEHDPILVEDEQNNPGTITGVIKKGFKHKEKLLRPARVQVVKEKEE